MRSCSSVCSQSMDCLWGLVFAILRLLLLRLLCSCFCSGHFCVPGLVFLVCRVHWRLCPFSGSLGVVDHGNYADLWRPRGAKWRYCGGVYVLVFLRTFGWTPNGKICLRSPTPTSKQHESEYRIHVACSMQE